MRQLFVLPTLDPQIFGDDMVFDGVNDRGNRLPWWRHADGSGGLQWWWRSRGGGSVCSGGSAAGAAVVLAAAAARQKSGVGSSGSGAGPVAVLQLGCEKSLM